MLIVTVVVRGNNTCSWSCQNASTKQDLKAPLELMMKVKETLCNSAPSKYPENFNSSGQECDARLKISVPQCSEAQGPSSGCYTVSEEWVQDSCVCQSGLQLQVILANRPPLSCFQFSSTNQKISRSASSSCWPRGSCWKVESSFETFCAEIYIWAVFTFRARRRRGRRCWWRLWEWWDVIFQLTLFLVLFLVRWWWL